MPIKPENITARLSSVGYDVIVMFNPDKDAWTTVTVSMGPSEVLYCGADQASALAAAANEVLASVEAETSEPENRLSVEPVKPCTNRLSVPL
jgi:hypothetical protein